MHRGRRTGNLSDKASQGHFRGSMSGRCRGIQFYHKFHQWRNTYIDLNLRYLSTYEGIACQECICVMRKSNCSDPIPPLGTP